MGTTLSGWKAENSENLKRLTEESGRKYPTIKLDDEVPVHYKLIAQLATVVGCLVPLFVFLFFYDKGDFAAHTLRWLVITPALALAQLLSLLICIAISTRIWSQRTPDDDPSL